MVDTPLKRPFEIGQSPPEIDIGAYGFRIFELTRA
jgi:hypothetical protein